MLRFSFSILLLCLAHSPVRADERIPAYLIGLPASVKTVFVAETTAARFHHFENINGQPTYVGQSHMSIGQNGDGKQRSGDQRTPLGIYFVTEQIDTSRLHEKYGVTAFVLDYPNVLDRHSGKTGDGIWVHGVDARGGKRPPQDTDGCIALPNEDFAVMTTLFESNTTPVIVGRELEWVSPEEIAALRLELEVAVAGWASSLEQGDMQAHLSFYSEDFHHWTMNKTEWSVLLQGTHARRPITDVTVSELLLLADPNDDGLYLSRFTESVTEDGVTVVSTRRLYWRRSADGALRIVAEDAG